MHEEPRAPHRRQERKANRHAGTVESLRVKLWEAIGRVAGLLDDPDADNDDVRKSAHCLAQLSGPYLKAVEVGELESRITELENR